MSTILLPQGMNTPVLRRTTMRLTTMRLRTALTATTSPTMHTTGRGRPFRCGVWVGSMRGYGLRKNG